MGLEKIGFYTLSDKRALGASTETPLWRCELVLTDRCNFKCPYCRGLREDLKGTMPLNEAMAVVDYWIDERLKNVRFTGGEPTLYKGLVALVNRCREGGVERIAISTNGSAPKGRYTELIQAGVNDFSISLDSGCCSTGEILTGGIKGAWEKVIETIRFLSERTYVSVGMVFTPENIERCVEDVLFADSLGVSDIRVIPSAQFNKALSKLANLPDALLAKYPILRYRIKNVRAGRHVRGIGASDCRKCWLALDDMAIAGGYHFPCIIHLREGGDPVGKVGSKMRQERSEWIQRHDSYQDPICRKNCLDVCVQYNNTADATHSFVGGKLQIQKEVVEV